MSILTYQIGEVGLSGVKPRIIYIETNDTIAAVTASGYLNTLVDKFHVQLAESDIALVATKATPNAASTQVGFFDVEFSSGQWSLVAPVNTVKFAGKESNGGGSATIAITVTGALATDIAFAQIEASTNAVQVQKVTPSADTVTVLLSGDPGAATVISYEVLRAAS